MQAQIVFAGGTSTIVDIEKILPTIGHDGHITKLEWTTPPDAYTTLKYIDPKQVVAIVTIRSMEESAR